MTPAALQGLVDYDGLRASGIWADGCAPSKATLSRWVSARRIPHVIFSARIIRFDVEAVRDHIRLHATVHAAQAMSRRTSGNLRARAMREAAARGAA